MARHHVVFGLGFGDEGKGTVVDYLSNCHRPDFVVRFNGGAQAAHNVVLPGGHHHTFAQYGSGTFQGAATFLSRFMIVNPITMLREREALEHYDRGYPMAHVDGRALVTTPYHVGLNQLREAILRHGSCGMGVGETKLWALEGFALRVVDLYSADLVQRLYKLRAQMLDVGTSIVKQAAGALDSAAIAGALQALTRDPRFVAESFDRWLRTVETTTEDWLHDQAKRGARFVFEGAQGVLLDELHGWAPNYTWSTCTPKNALELADEAGIPRDDIEVLGVLRAYHTRHGAGPLPTEYVENTPQPRWDDHNGQHPWQGPFRWGWFDARLAAYALECSGRVDGLAITHLDRTPPNGEFVYANVYAGDDGKGRPDIADARVIADLVACEDRWESVLDAVRSALPDGAPPVRIASFGPTCEDKKRLEVQP